MKLTRRQTLSALAATTAIPLAASCATTQKEGRVRPIGLQLWTVKEDLARDLQGTLNQVAAIGYREVEFASFVNRTGPQLRQALDQAGLTCPSAHVPLDRIRPDQPSLSDPETVDLMHAIGATQAVVPIFPMTGVDFGSIRDQMQLGAAIWRAGQAMNVDDWKGFAHRLNEAGRTLARAGLHIGYHNHNLEFAQLSDGSTPLDVLMRETDPSLVSFELDIGWAEAAGVDVVAFLNTHGSRINQLHVKDTAQRTGTGFDFKTADLGAGIIDWTALLQAVNRAPRIEHIYVEQEEPFTRAPMEEARTAFEFLRSRPELPH